jgi:ABC-2 type transport system permease protein
MSIAAPRIFSLIIKEFLSLFRDNKSRVVIIVPPILQLFVFAFAATLEVKHVSIAILNKDTGKYSQQFISNIVGSNTFTDVKIIQREEQIKPYIDQQKVISALTIPEDFSKKIEANRGTTIQLILDGRRSNATQIINGYISSMIQQFNLKLMHTKNAKPIKIRIVERNWFNENLLYLWFTVPSLICILSMLVTLVITSLSVARERELGTFDQLLVSPLIHYEILIGKTIPAIIIGMAEGFLIWFAAVWIFRIPFTGHSLYLVFVLFVFIMSIVGVGLFISAMSKTQQQAILGAFIFMVPAVTLSGYASPIENMPVWLQHATQINPLKHVLISIKGIFLKNMSIADVWHNTWPLILISIITLPLAGYYFAKRVE